VDSCLPTSCPGKGVRRTEAREAGGGEYSLFGDQHHSENYNEAEAQNGSIGALWCSRPVAKNISRRMRNFE
jgi:hypothetical protein